MSNHTKGPWRLRELTNGTLAVYGQGEYDIVFPVRSVEPEALANAALIAAAPDQHQQLQRTLGKLREWYAMGKLPKKAADILMADIEAVLTKAEPKP